ncbi:MAG: hypothetical protein IPF58_07840 [Saprospirales bacterium]|nr:hypothetical protein [Saprospirales bacterium]
MVFVAANKWQQFYHCRYSLPSLPIGPVILTNVTISGGRGLIVLENYSHFTMRFVSGNIVVGSIPLNIAGQSFSGNFTR